MSSKPGLPKYYLGCDYSTIASDGGDFRGSGTQTHINKAISKAYNILGKLHGIYGYTIRVNTRKGKQTSLSARIHPKTNETKLFGGERCNAYQRLIGILQWFCCIVRWPAYNLLCLYSVASQFVLAKSH